MLKILLVVVLAMIGAVEVIVGKKDKNQPKADMYLPSKLPGIVIVLMILALGLGIYGFTNGHWLVYAGVAGALLVAVCAFLCWKNQKVRIVSEEEFTYTTFLGHTRTYRFEDIRQLRQNQDSMTLILKDGKVHIESMAVLSQALIDKINQAFPEESE